MGIEVDLLIPDVISKTPALPTGAHPGRWEGSVVFVDMGSLTVRESRCVECIVHVSSEGDITIEVLR